MEQLAFVQKFQQCTGPIMAKGLEDTAFYVYNRLVSLNEVGGDPSTFGISAADFHAQNAERLERWPYSMLATSTHDTKRSEDVRARINVLSEMPNEWQAAVTRWSDLNRAKKRDLDGEPAPDANEEYLIYQTLLGAWPLGAPSPSEYQEFKERIQAYMTKASKEAKVNTSWISPNEEYDQALSTFIEAVLDPDRSKSFLEDFNDFQKTVSHFGIFNSLSQVLLKIASPGVPDLYQGCELFDLSLVDPDNRRPVDYPTRIRRLEEIKKEMMSDLPSPQLIDRLLREKENGPIKLFVTWRALACRREHRRLFLNGAYIPHEGIGSAKEHLIAFSRRLNGEQAIVAAPRFLVSLIDRSEIPIGAVWKGSHLLLDDEQSGAAYRNVLTGERVETERENGKTRLPADQIFKTFPLALLVKQTKT